jgi:hypothetical protein
MASNALFKGKIGGSKVAAKWLIWAFSASQGTQNHTLILFLISLGLILFSFGLFLNTPGVLSNKAGLFQNKGWLFQNNPRLLTSRRICICSYVRQIKGGISLFLVFIWRFHS